MFGSLPRLSTWYLVEAPGSLQPSCDHEGESSEDKAHAKNVRVEIWGTGLSGITEGCSTPSL